MSALAVQEEHQGVLQGHELATMQALLEQQVLPGTAAVVAATGDQDGMATGKNMMVPRVLVPLAKVCCSHSGGEQGVQQTMLLCSVCILPGFEVQGSLVTDCTTCCRLLFCPWLV